MLRVMKPADFLKLDLEPQPKVKPSRDQLDAIAWFDACMKRAQENGPFSEPMKLNKAKAELLLGKNPSNRRITERNINGIASDIKAALWTLNGETIVVSDEGLLNDGQTRLSAVVLTDTTIETFVVFGVKRNTRFSTDMGAARTVSHLLGMGGAVSSSAAAAVAAWLINYEKGIVLQSGATYPTKLERSNRYWAEQKDIDDAIRFVTRKNATELRSQSALAVAYLLIFRKVGSEADYFFEKLCEGAGYDIGSPLHHTRSRLKEMTQTRRQAGQKIAVIIVGWNYWRRRKQKVRSIPVKLEYPEIED